ncbi:HIRAN domain-containing protein [Haloimpatiens massiliensis]|uniref:HIRAN domain-containing protein n=1 Tax=Haloimpatiens massiliensis TaxID=1658110 RepID=UPI000C81B046|nr:HIRAN domain-containing protein [Haloimpatiens massiliensis]
MSKGYITIVGCEHYFGDKILRVGQIVNLIKDYENEYDDEAIKVEISSIGKVGYVANSPYTVARGCKSAGRIYDSFEEKITASIKFIVKGVAIAEIHDNSNV